MRSQVAEYPEPFLPRNKRLVEHVVQEGVFALGEPVKDGDGLQDLVGLPAFALHKGEGLDRVRLDGLGGSHGLLLRDGASPVALALEHSLADVGPDLVLKGINGVGKLAVVLDRSWRYPIFLSKAFVSFRDANIAFRFLIAMPTVLALFQVVALPAQIALLLGREVAAPELGGDHPVDGLFLAREGHLVHGEGEAMALVIWTHGINGLRRKKHALPWPWAFSPTQAGGGAGETSDRSPAPVSPSTSP
jgi:hypothetical protein